MVDKKALTTKAFVSQIEVIMETQIAHHAMLVDPLYVRACLQHWLAYKVSLDDEAVVALSRSRSPAPTLALVPVLTMMVANLNLAGAEKRRLKWW